MTRRRLVDTNLIIRHLVQDHEKQAKIAGELFEACDRGGIILVILPAVLAECVFVLESFYQHRRADIASALSQLISSPGIELRGAAVHLDALERYQREKLHFVDCLIAATSVAEDAPVATFDREFRRFPDVRVQIG